MNGPAFAISALGIPWALLATFKIGPTFMKMFADFASELPQLTQFMVMPWAPLALSFVSLAIVAASHRFARHVPVIVAITTTLLQPAIFVVAMYLPIFSVASTIS